MEIKFFKRLGPFHCQDQGCLFTFIIDLKPYEQVINTISSEPGTITDTTWQVVSHNIEQENQVFTKSLRQLGQELRTTRETFTCMIESYVQYKSLQGRQKRSLLPFVEKAMHFLFGTITDSDLKAVRRNVEHLAENQQKLKHVVHKSHSHEPEQTQNSRKPSDH